jgi:hypothetical protein
MSRPDLLDPDQRRAYRAELRRVYWPWRMGALALVLAGLIGWVTDDAHPGWWEGLMLVGGIAAVTVVAARTRYHLRRMR